MTLYQEICYFPNDVHWYKGLLSNGYSMGCPHVRGNNTRAISRTVVPTKSNSDAIFCLQCDSLVPSPKKNLLRKIGTPMHAFIII